MTKISVLFGLLLIALGVGFWFGTGRTHTTALFPVGFGLVIVVCGLIAIKGSVRKKAAHAGAFFGLLGAGGGFGMAIPKFLSNEAGSAALEQLLMGALCVVYLVFCVRSFIAARSEARRVRAAIGK